MSNVSAPNQRALPYHAESRSELQGPAERIFAHLDDQERLAERTVSDAHAAFGATAI